MIFNLRQKKEKKEKEKQISEIQKLLDREHNVYVVPIQKGKGLNIAHAQKALEARRISPFI